jgi:hypothetical protein
LREARAREQQYPRGERREVMTEQQYEYIVVGKGLMGEQGDAGERSSHAADTD